MYMFVLEWTPALTPAEPVVAEAKQETHRRLLADDDKSSNPTEDEDGHIGSIPHGYIFAAFMVRVTGKHIVIP